MLNGFTFTHTKIQPGPTFQQPSPYSQADVHRTSQQAPVLPSHRQFHHSDRPDDEGDPPRGRLQLCQLCHQRHDDKVIPFKIFFAHSFSCK